MTSLKVMSFLLQFKKELFKLMRDDVLSLVISNEQFELATIFVEHGFELGEDDCYSLFKVISKNCVSLVQGIISNQPLMIFIDQEDNGNVFEHVKTVEMAEALIAFFPSRESDGKKFLREKGFRFQAQAGNLRIARSIMPFEARLFELKRIAYRQESMLLTTSRSNILENAFYALYPTLARHNFKPLLRISFQGEVANDLGGLLRDWSSAIAGRLFQKHYRESSEEPKLEASVMDAFAARALLESFKVFTEPPFLVKGEEKVYFINPEFDGPVDFFNFLGYFLAHCLLKNIPLGVRLAPSIVKLLLGLQLNFKDLKDDDLQNYNSLLALRDPSMDLEAMELYFPTNLGIKVTRENLENFLNERAEFLLLGQHDNRLQLIAKGFLAAMKMSTTTLCSHLSWNELSDLFYGQPEVSVEELKANIRLAKVVQDQKTASEYFYAALGSMPQDDLRKLLKFITGNENLPFGGVKALGKKINISQSTDDNFRVFTCFCNFYIPFHCTSPEQFREQLLATIYSAEEFSDLQNFNRPCCRERAEVGDY